MSRKNKGSGKLGGKVVKVKPPHKLASVSTVDSAMGDSDWYFGVSTKTTWRCHEKHPVLSLGGGTVLGASCNSPRDGYDIYVGLDWGMQRRSLPFPWNPPVESKVVEVYFPVTDGSVPEDVEQFKRMVDWLVDRLGEGKRVHIGCIGGHGRTGTLLAALVSRVHGDSKAGEWVRKHYCKSAIETTEQIKFLSKHFGIDPVAPSKEGYTSGAGGGKASSVASTFKPLSSSSIWDSAWVVERDEQLTNYGRPSIY